MSRPGPIIIRASETVDIDELAQVLCASGKYGITLSLAKDAMTIHQPPRNLAADVAAFSDSQPVSTLCAVCDQIKELHPSTHPWMAKPPVVPALLRRQAGPIQDVAGVDDHSLRDREMQRFGMTEVRGTKAHDR